MAFTTEFLKIKTGETVNFIRFTAITALEFQPKNLSISLSIQDQKENFIIKCSSAEIFGGYASILNKVLSLNWDYPPKQASEQVEAKDNDNPSQIDENNNT